MPRPNAASSAGAATAGAITDAAEADCTASVTGSAQRSRPGRSAGASVRRVEEELAEAVKPDSLGRFLAMPATKASAQAGRTDPCAETLMHRPWRPRSDQHNDLRLGNPWAARDCMM